jgi:hypothetical protein
VDNVFQPSALAALPKSHVEIIIGFWGLIDFVFDGNNLGVGTSNPSQKLTVVGDISVKTGNRLYLWDSTNNYAPYLSNPSVDTIAFYNSNSSERMRIDSSGSLLVGTSGAPTTGGLSRSVVSFKQLNDSGTSANIIYSSGIQLEANGNTNVLSIGYDGSSFGFNASYRTTGGYVPIAFWTSGNERLRIDISGNLLVGKTVNDTTTNGCNISAAGRGSFSSNGQAVGDYNRTGDDGVLVNFLQDGTIEGTISVSGSTVSYNGGHLSRWSQWQNKSGQPDIYRGTVLESTNDMCEWGQTNEQSTKTIVSTTTKSKAVAGVFDMYDFDDKTNPNDFYVAQSGDFVIRIAQGVVVENGDLLESAGDGTARPQTDDICRSSTIAKVTSNYVSTTYADGSFCVPCILMIG